MNFHRKMHEGKVRAINVTEFIGELVTAAFAGLLTFWLCKGAKIDDLYAAVLIGVSGHMGSRAIFALERWGERRFLGGTKPDGAIDATDVDTP